MATFETLKDYDRLASSYKVSLVRQVLPEYFTTSYPNLVTFLEAYYEHLDSDENFGGIVNEILTIRDVEDVTLKRLDFVLDEIALGVSHTQFTFPREALRNFGNFFRVKGSLYSAEGFFRAFFGVTNVEITYPKNSLLRVGDLTQGKIGPEDAFVLQDGRIFQIFSVLIKSPLSLNDWEILYRNFVHPSGFFLGAEVEVITEGQVTIITAESITDPDPRIKVIEAASFNMSGDREVSILVADDQDADSAQQRYNPYRTTNFFGGRGVSLLFLAKIYSNLDELAGYGISFDDAGTALGSGITFDNTFDTFDQREFKRYSNSMVSSV
jgi:hypothetical protein